MSENVRKNNAAASKEGVAYWKRAYASPCDYHCHQTSQMGRKQCHPLEVLKVLY
ncbi:hypothetical protein FOMG_18955 [Fusarium oxysporum f. sp. melonis 26406]|uniref:Uncharacterized protein n=1 Tax=Fusarium oxysporum f. sp. melonis 26406 TaxID=1089452 RepID=W9Z7R7_FUSOX|nr:hypothetical protein FOMG_18954 [Fusarium oxysporum f. sp. melonis 26406]EXK24308.1 hypothetical protein FOMG_18955 [Fusarium oxysporum f. sp. melonis 26406]